MFPRMFLLVLLALLLSGSFAAADDWKVSKVSGDARVFRQGVWMALKLDDVVSDDSMIHTLADGSLQFTRDGETIDLAPDTQIQIIDRTDRRDTTVREHFGTVGIEANVEKVRHFTVQTSFLAAAVKGTIFGVHSDSRGATVIVQRGLVGVLDLARNLEIDILPGQAASVSPGRGLGVSVATAAPGTPSVETAAAAAATAAAAPPAAFVPPAGAVNIATGGGDNSVRFTFGLGAEPSAQAAAEPEDTNPSAFVEGRNGRLVMTPLHQIVLALKGFDRLMFWSVFFAVFVGVGFLLDAFLKEIGFGAPANALIAAVAGVVGILLRDWLIVDGGWLAYEPYMTIAFILTPIAAAVVVLNLNKNR